MPKTVNKTIEVKGKTKVVEIVAPAEKARPSAKVQQKLSAEAEKLFTKRNS